MSFDTWVLTKKRNVYHSHSGSKEHAFLRKQAADSPDTLLTIYQTARHLTHRDPNLVHCFWRYSLQWARASRGFQITHNDALQSVGLLWNSDQLVAETTTLQHTTLTTDKHPYLRWDSNPQQPPVGHGLLIHEVSRSHTTTHHSRQDSSGRVISSSQRPLPYNT